MPMGSSELLWMWQPEYVNGVESDPETDKVALWMFVRVVLSCRRCLRLSCRALLLWSRSLSSSLAAKPASRSASVNNCVLTMSLPKQSGFTCELESKSARFHPGSCGLRKSTPTHYVPISVTNSIEYTVVVRYTMATENACFWLAGRCPAKWHLEQWSQVTAEEHETVDTFGLQY